MCWLSDSIPSRTTKAVIHLLGKIGTFHAEGGTPGQIWIRRTNLAAQAFIGPKGPRYDVLYGEARFLVPLSGKPKTRGRVR